MKRRVDSKAVTTTIAALIACGVMGSAVSKIMLKRVGQRANRPAAIEETEKPSQSSPKPSRVARSLTA